MYSVTNDLNSPEKEQTLGTTKFGSLVVLSESHEKLGPENTIVLVLGGTIDSCIVSFKRLGVGSFNPILFSQDAVLSRIKCRPLKDGEGVVVEYKE
jgi:hypothetical protein